jgi:hypothetical protein
VSAAPRNRSRPKGYTSTVTWQPVTWSLVRQAKEVLDQYRDYLPLTARQIFYRMVAAFDYDKTEQAYGRLCEALVKARRAQVIPFSAIRDDGTEEAGSSGGFDGTADWWKTIKTHARYYRRDRMEGQPVAIEVWCEGASMAPQLGRVTSVYGINAYGTGGFSSVTVTKEIADRVGEREVPTVFLHVGDFDPSGESIFNSMAEDVLAFVAGDLGDWDEAEETFKPVRVALTGEQVAEYGFPTAPPKKSDSRSRNWYGETCQLEAMDPPVLDAVLRGAIEEQLDLERREETLELEREERRDLMAAVASYLDGQPDEDDGDD